MRKGLGAFLLIGGFYIWIGYLIKYQDMTHSGIINKYYGAQYSDEYNWCEIWTYKTMAHMLRPNNEIPLEIKRILI